MKEQTYTNEEKLLGFLKKDLNHDLSDYYFVAIVIMGVFLVVSFYTIELVYVLAALVILPPIILAIGVSYNKSKKKVNKNIILLTKLLCSRLSPIYEMELEEERYPTRFKAKKDDLSDFSVEFIRWIPLPRMALFATGLAGLLLSLYAFYIRFLDLELFLSLPLSVFLLGSSFLERDANHLELNHGSLKKIAKELSQDSEARIQFRIRNIFFNDELFKDEKERENLFFIHLESTKKEDEDCTNILGVLNYLNLKKEDGTK